MSNHLRVVKPVRYPDARKLCEISGNIKPKISSARDTIALYARNMGIVFFKGKNDMTFMQGCGSRCFGRILIWIQFFFRSG